MRLGSCLIPATLAAGLALLALPSPLHTQEPALAVSVALAAELPDSPQPQFAVRAADDAGQQTPPAQQTPASPDANPQQPAPASTPGQNTPAQSSSSSQTTAQPPNTEKSQHEKAEEQIKEQEQQRVLGVVPAFNISYRPDAVSLTAGQKIKLALHSSTDVVAFGVALVVGGYHETLADDKGFGWGPEGYGKRAGAAYLDAFDGAIIGNGILPAILHQDPRYFRLGHGTATHRLLYSLATNVVCRHDNTRKWEPNYSNVAGNIISGAISNLYYPASNSGWSETITNGFTVTAEGAFGSVFEEFWPDVCRHLFHKDPTHGRDAQVRALDAAEKQARKEAKEKKEKQQQQEQPAPK